MPFFLVLCVSPTVSKLGIKEWISYTTFTTTPPLTFMLPHLCMYTHTLGQLLTPKHLQLWFLVFCFSLFSLPGITYHPHFNLSLSCLSMKALLKCSSRSFTTPTPFSPITSTARPFFSFCFSHTGLLAVPVIYISILWAFGPWFFQNVLLRMSFLSPHGLLPHLI